MTPIERVLGKLHQVRKTGHGQWSALCPAHEADGRRHKPSLSVGLGDSGAVLLTCHAGCDLAEILAALELTAADLFPAATRGSRAPAPSKSCPVIPAWIRADPAWRRLKAPARWLLHVAAEDCRDVIDAAGSRGYAALAGTVIAEAGMSRRAVQMSAAELAAAGFLVKVYQGGQVAALPGKAGPARQYRCNLYAVPGSRGALAGIARKWDNKG